MSCIEGKVVAVSVSDKRGVPKTNVEKVTVLPDWGIEGDAHAGRHHRQVSLLAVESVEKMKAMGAKVSPGIFGENITTEFINIPELKIGQKVVISDVLFQITQIGKECLTPCAIFHQVGDCVMPREGVFAQVIEGGEIGVGDLVTVRPVQ